MIINGVQIDDTFAEAFKAMVGELITKDSGVIAGAGEVSVVAHRVVHGGEKFTYIPCLNDQEGGIDVIEATVLRELQGWV